MTKPLSKRKAESQSSPADEQEQDFWNTPGAATRTLHFTGELLTDEQIDVGDMSGSLESPLPKVPREISFTAHWLAVEGVQPSIPQNPTQADQRNQELMAKGPGANPHLAAVSGNDNVSVKPLVKHVLSKELQLYFERICGAILDDANDEYRTAAFASLRTDPGLHQLVG